MNGKRLLLVVGAASAIAACSVGRPVPQATTYIVDPPAGTAGASIPRRAEALRMGNVRVAAPYAGTALVYRLDDVRYASDPYHAFAADPAAMLGSRIAQWLDHADPFSTVAQPGSTRPTPYVLEATVDELYGDFRKGRPPAAVLSVQFILIEQAVGRPKVIYERTIARRVDLTKASPDALVRGYSTALAEILTQLASELGAEVAH
jgi:cholesterol transport system auxiliary component